MGRGRICLDVRGFRRKGVCNNSPYGKPLNLSKCANNSANIVILILILVVVVLAGPWSSLLLLSLSTTSDNKSSFRNV